ncbi:GNAT family N-acetyltransferase [Ovoidimarina sediminis]|uniref:GNAT family N-acetyltransferase n=1 Tax=Ovoidimarina sediminis TaxID=3079856 RepID=UPI002911E07B|nr:GNAT family N-acetyltransferase [Rhodophyticola sp. MJ-SS7]MDU8944570.1 GNAT family N-acetyltransferase [Rhodophyticola sp. MJ-SS7]
MTPEDIAALYARAVPYPVGWGPDDLRKILAHPGAFITSLAHAFALGRVAADEAELLLIATDPDHRRTGAATHCLAAFEDEARARGAVTAFLEVAESNAPARALYAARGYEKVGQRPGYYASADGTKETALILRRDLT